MGLGLTCFAKDQLHLFVREKPTKHNEDDDVKKGDLLVSSVLRIESFIESGVLSTFPFKTMKMKCLAVLSVL